ncbi:MAG TPA: tripartite tricarboxylate transporter substrate-binding protein [Xanthobacteraceae bacterium]|jgi:tripartite-type tricarboxylate transporter receptor subunit TctC|nr:tripartite tricarboxylate transporter substrate-binding protein [Xanthobacteraceae bacterium]
MRKAFLQFLCLIASLTLVAECRAEGVADFYKGKTIMLSVGYTAGGGYDALARIVAQHMSQYIPGNPHIVVANEPGAGTLMLANRLFNVAPRDGTQFGLIARGMAIEPLIGTSNVMFDPAKFTWLGSAANEVSLCVTYGGAAVKTWHDALTTPFTVGGAGSGSDPDVFANVLRNLFGMKDRLVTGYPGTPELSLAMERGEIDGRCGWSWASIKWEKGDWVTQKKLNVLVQMALAKASDLPNVPLITDVAQNEEQRQILKLVFSRQVTGRPFVAPPGIPEDRKLALRAAFDQTMKDADFRHEAQNNGIEISSVSGAEIDALLSELYRMPPDVVAKAREAVTAK